MSQVNLSAKGVLSFVTFGTVVTFATGDPVFGVVGACAATLVVDVFEWAGVLGFGRENRDAD
jgi:hypothetical protein